MMSTKRLILRRYMAENSKNVNTSQNKTSIFMIFLEKIANQHREAVLKFQDNCSLSPGFWQSFISIEVCRDCIPALASSCKKQLTGFFVCLLFFLKVKRIS